MNSITIGNSKVGPTEPTYFIAEIGSNFDGDFDKARRLIQLAKESGADAAKFQHYTASSLVSNHGFENLQINNTHQSDWKSSVYDVYEAASLDAAWTSALVDICKEVEIDFLTSPYSLELIDFVDEFVPAYKVGSGDITWHEAIKRMASKKKPLLIAAGASNFLDVELAVNAAKGANGLVLMQCNTNYTAEYGNYQHLNLNVLNKFHKHFPHCVLGLSDHMPGHIEVMGAVALGARVIEKHFTDSNQNIGPDHKFALDPGSFKKMVSDVRALELALGAELKTIEDNEVDTAIVQRRAVRAAVDLKPGDFFTEENLTVLRPCPPGSVLPYEIDQLFGKKAISALSKGQSISRSEYFNENK